MGAKAQRIAIAALGVFLWSCSTVPITGRRQFTPIPMGQMMELSQGSYQQLVEKLGLSENRQQAQMVKKVGSDISDAVERYMREHDRHDEVDHFNWEYHLLDSPEVNAFCMPGGKIGFYDGIMPIAQGPDGVAVIMGHEVAHAIAQHSNERMAQVLAAQLGGVALAVALQEKPSETRQLALAAFGIGAQVGVMLPFSRLHEREADEMGLIFMAMAGYDPREAPDLWQRMKQNAEGPRPPEFLSTHPSPESRIKRLQKLMPKAMKYYRDNGGKVSAR